MVIAAPLLLLVGILFAPFLRRLPRAIFLRFLTAGLLFVGGAFGLELVGGHYVSSLGFGSSQYRIASSAEECLEIAGLTLFASTLLSLIARRAPKLTIALRYSGPAV